MVGSNISSSEVQHSVGGEDSSRASESVRAAKDVGRSKESEQVIPSPCYKGRGIERQAKKYTSGIALVANTCMCTVYVYRETTLMWLN